MEAMKGKRGERMKDLHTCGKGVVFLGIFFCTGYSHMFSKYNSWLAWN